MRLPTFSNLWLARKCPAALALPLVNTENEAAERGTSRHAFNAARKTVGKKAALEAVKVEHRDEASNLDTATIDAFFAGMESVRSEVSYAYNPDTDQARELGENLGRNYRKAGARPDEEICGTTDDIATDGNIIRLLDLKGRAKKDPIQLQAQAIAAARVLGVDDVEAAFGYVQDDGSIQTERYHFDALDLDVIREDLRDVKERVKRVHLVVAEGRTPDLFEGEHCTWCPARKACPAKTSLIKAAAQAALELPTVSVKDLTQAQKASLYRDVVRRYKPVIEAFEDEIKADVLDSSEPLDLGDGTMLAVMPGKDSIDASVAFKVLTAEYDAEKAKQATKLSVTKDMLKKACGRDIGRILQLIEQAGGIEKGKPYVKAVRR